MTRSRVKVTGATETRRGLNAVNTYLKRPDFDSAVNYIAQEWNANFISEGSPTVGGARWAKLRPYTVEVRKQRWYGSRSDHPILNQTGGLYEAAVLWPMHVRGPGFHHVANFYPPPDAHSTDTLVGFNQRGLRAEIFITGEKVKNQYGYESDFGTTVPARPFWFWGGRVPDAAGRGIWEKVGLKIWSSF